MGKNYIFLFLNLVLFSVQLYAQDVYSQAPEIWSEPQKIITLNLNGNYAEMPSIMPDGKTIYFMSAYIDSPAVIFSSYKTDTGWSIPKKLNSNINATMLERNPSISPDGKKLYFIRYDNGGYGDWDLWVSEWSDSLNDWDTPKNLGSNINTDATEYICYTPDNKNLYFTRQGGFLTDIMISEWNDTTQQWGTSSLFDNHKLNIGNAIEGITMTGNKKKLYFGMYNFLEYSSYNHDEYDIYVSYYDSAKKLYGTPMLLNINSHPDSSVPNYNPYNLGCDSYPTITSDGRYLYFSSNRKDTNYLHSGTPVVDIYESRLLVDENGDTITSVEEKNTQIKSIHLYQNYPNPFNPSTKISFSLSDATNVKILIYDNLGRKIRKLVDMYFRKGDNIVVWDGRDDAGNRLSSGVYYYSLLTGKDNIVKKMILLK
jgi:hypothetical protein